jgi:hypothetical protein
VRLSEGTHDPLQAKTLVIESNSQRVALVALDLASIPRDYVDEARRLIQIANPDLTAAQVMISATHSHTGPELSGRLRNVEPATEALALTYYKRLPSLIAESVTRAVADLRPARLQTAVGREDSISFVRRFRMTDGTVGWNPGKRNPKIVAPIGDIDPDVPVVAFEDDKGAPLAAYVNFANHLDTVGGTQFSADYPYTLSKLLAAAKGSPDYLTLFTIGCAGNINHVDVRHTRPQKGHGEAARIGTVLAAAVLKAMESLRPIATPLDLRWSTETLQLAPDTYPKGDVAKAQDTIAAYGKPNARPFYEQVHAFKVMDLEQRAGKPLDAEVQVIALNRDIAWVALPGEIFVDLGRAIKSASPFPVTIIAELANGTLGYVPDRKAYPEGAYEVISTRLAPGGGEQMVESAVRQLVQAYRQASPEPSIRR